MLPVTSVCFTSIKAELNEVQLQNFLPNIEIMATNEEVPFWAVKYTCVLKCMSHMRRWKEESNMVYRECKLSSCSYQSASQNTPALLCVDIRDAGKGCQSGRPTFQRLHWTG